MTASEHTELLPCPLCGASLFHNGASELGDIYEHPANGCAIQVAWFTARPEWIAAWNRRALPDGAEPVPVAQPDYWAVHSGIGVLIGLWKDHQTALKVTAEYSMSKPVITPLFASPTGMGVTEGWQRAAMDETIRGITGLLTWGDVPLSRPDTDLVEHIKGMPARMTADYSPAKIGRWLGWVQGVACANGWLHLDDCKRINKEASAALHPTSETTPAPSERGR